MSEYVAPTLTVDAVVFQIRAGALEVLLVKRKRDPFKGRWSLPGGYCAAGQTTHDALKAITNRKAGVDIDGLNHIEQLMTFDTVARDPRGHAVSVAYMILGTDVEPRQDSETESPNFYPIDELPELVFDHQQIIEMAHQRLANKSTYSNIVGFLLPKRFTQTELQNSYETILGRELDKRNFRKKFLSLDLIVDTGRKTKGGAYRPASLYRFKSRDIKLLERNFE